MPTPLAVALSDFCRRAQAPASAAEVREALALLSPSDDFRVRELTDAEPPARPLGPFAAVDLIYGTRPDEASRRHGCGYYELARELAAQRERTVPASLPPEPAPMPLPTPVAPPAPSRPKARKGTLERESTLSERIAPKKRVAEPAPPSSRPIEPVELPSPKRSLHAPRGRFTRLPATKVPIEELLPAEGKELLSGLMRQHGHRFAVLNALAVQYTGRRGAALGLRDLEPLLSRHALVGELEAREREMVCSGYREHKGAAGKVAWALGLTTGELQLLVRSLELTREVEEIREHYRKDALAPRNLALRLDLLGRTKYLADLGIAAEFNARLAAELKELLDGCAASGSGEARLQAAARNRGVSVELLSRAVDKLRLSSHLND